MSARRLAALVWAAPNSLLGGLLGLPLLCSGGRLHRVAGNVEISGGCLGRAIARLPAGCRFGAITFGHVILGVDGATLSALRSHEAVHVRQYERWGIFFLPAYAASSAWQLLSGGHVYRDNHFERQAFESERMPVKPPPARAAPSTRRRSRSGRG